MKTTPELVSPAGGREAAWAALHYGADAVYIGLPRFSARADAENVTQKDLDEIICYAHQLTPRRRVFVTANTLVQDHELPDLARLLADVEACGADAVIVQDVGVMGLIRRSFPGLRIHASTQMAVHSLEGARTLKELGCTRVVLARELTLEEIRHISQNAGIETEVFIHGALCYSYSGLCLFSSHTMGRSGNRGRCAYCCRDVFRAGETAPQASPSMLQSNDGHRTEGGGYTPVEECLPFSMKDLALGEYLPELEKAGVAALKVEGRMKSALYVGAVTDYYRRMLDGKLQGRSVREVEENLRTIFSRPWTTLYVDPGKAGQVVDAVNVGHRGALVGKVGSIRSDRDGKAWLHFRAGRALEKHDGLQIDLPDSPRPFGFPVDELRLAGSGQRPRIETPAGAEVEVQLPAGAPQIPAGAPVYCASSQAVKRRYKYPRPRPGVFRQRWQVSVDVFITTRTLTARAAGAGTAAVVAEVNLEGNFEKARNPEKTADAFRQAFERTGDTRWTAADVNVNDPERLFVPLAVMNDLRRRLVALLDEEYDKQYAARLEAVQAVTRSEAPQDDGLKGEHWSVKVNDPDILEAFDGKDCNRFDEMVVPAPLSRSGAWRKKLQAVADRIPRLSVRVALPTIIRGADAKALRETVSSLCREGIRCWEVQGLGGLALLKDVASAEVVGALDIVAGWPFYALNRLSVRQFADLGMGHFVLSPEDDGENIVAMLKLFGSRAIVPLFEHTPLFLSQTAPSMPGGGTGEPPLPEGRGFHNDTSLPRNCTGASPTSLSELRRGRLAIPPLGLPRGSLAKASGVLLEPRSRQKYRIWQEGTRFVVTDVRPFCISGRLEELRLAGGRRFRVDFAYWSGSAAEALQAWNQVHSGQPVPGSHEGNYARGLA